MDGVPIRLVVRTSENPYGSSGKTKAVDVKKALRSRTEFISEPQKNDDESIKQQFPTTQEKYEKRKRNSARIVLKSSKPTQSDYSRLPREQSSASPSAKPSVVSALRTGRAKKVLPRHISKKGAFAQRSRSYKR